jgi:PHD/YefM family antitoxin component YafN of YafNO toxin-antitoxin module
MHKVYEQFVLVDGAEYALASFKEEAAEAEVEERGETSRLL